jgi:hypothetical protein
VSVDLEQLLAEDGLPLLFMYPAVHNNVGAAAHPISLLREKRLDVLHDPIKTNWYHGGICGNLTKSIKTTLAKSAEPLIQIDEAEAERFWNAVHGAKVEDRTAPNQ